MGDGSVRDLALLMGDSLDCLDLLVPLEGDGSSFLELLSVS